MPLFEMERVYYHDDIVSSEPVEIGEPSAELDHEIAEMESIGDNGLPVDTVEGQ